MRRVLFTLAISLTPALLPVLATPAAAQPTKAGPGITAVKTANDTILALIKKKAPPADVTKAVRAFFDIDQLGKAAMTDQWAKLKPAEQTEFLKLLRELIEASYLGIQNSNVNYTTDYVSETTNAQGNVVVATKVKTTRKGRPFTMTIDYVLVKNGANLQAFDLVTDGASTVDNYRQMFNKLMKDKGYPALIEKMKTKLAELQKNAAAPAGGAPATGAAKPASAKT